MVHRNILFFSIRIYPNIISNTIIKSNIARQLDRWDKDKFACYTTFTIKAIQATNLIMWIRPKTIS